MWRRHAEAIPDETLRRVALDPLQAKRGNLEGAVAFATLAQREHRLLSARAMIAFEAAFDYLDCLRDAERRSHRQRSPPDRGVDRRGPIRRSASDYYAHHSRWADGGIYERS